MEGNRYIDFASGIAVLSTGHNHPKVVAAVRANWRSSATCFQGHPYPGYIELAEKLNALVPGPTPKAHPLPLHRRRGGGERHQDARAHTGRSGTIAFKGLPRPHHDGDGAHRQGGALQDRLRPLPGRGLSPALPADYLG